MVFHSLDKCIQSEPRALTVNVTVFRKPGLCTVIDLRLGGRYSVRMRSRASN